MGSLSENFSNQLIELIEEDPDYVRAKDIALAVSEGEVFLIGGAVARRLFRVVYGDTKLNDDYDFAITGELSLLQAPNGIGSRINSYGNPKFFFRGHSGGEITVDIIPLLRSFSQPPRNRFPPTIDNFLATAPIVFQGIAYDIRRKIVFGPGVQAVLDRDPRVGSLEELKSYADAKKVSAAELWRVKTAFLGVNRPFSDYLSAVS
ncbi:MAG: hypothetical protein WCT46_01915 [Candidatus Gracilibacteria bacterium]|jgi:hypothetical protein